MLMQLKFALLLLTLGTIIVLADPTDPLKSAEEISNHPFVHVNDISMEMIQNQLQDGNRRKRSPFTNWAYSKKWG